MRDPEKHLTLWRQIADRLSEEVTAGRFVDGRLPTEPQLAARFGVNRHTIRRAIGVLADQGLITVEQGLGTFVAKHLEYLLGRRPRFNADLRSQGREPGRCVLSVATIEADTATASDLRLNRGASVLQIEMIAYADSVAVSYGIHSFPARRFAALPKAFADTNSITAALVRCGVSDYTREVTRLLTRLPSEREARYLEQAPSRPVLQAEAINVDMANVRIQRSLVVFAGDRVQFRLPGGNTGEGIMRPGSGSPSANRRPSPAIIGG
jgi:GntR family transcriptional regulator, phosphonate transport system regulatory protein